MWAPNGIHPDQHAIVINPGNPTQIFEGSDGGVIRTSGTFSDISSQCNYRTAAAAASAAASCTNCKRLLSRVPIDDHAHQQEPRAARSSSSTSRSTRRTRAEVMGGTQDNGTWSNNNGCDTEHVHAGDLRRRRQRRLRRDEPDVAVQRVHERVQRLELPRTATRRSGSSPRRRSSTAARPLGVLLAADRRPEPGRRARTRSTRRAQHVWRTLGLRSRPSRRSSAGHDSGHRLLRGELSGVHDVRRPARLRRLPAARRADRTSAATCTNRPAT